MRTGRPMPPLTVTPEERETLERWARRPKTAQAMAQRARLAWVLLATIGLSQASCGRDSGSVADVAAYEYPTRRGVPACAPGTRPGRAGLTDGERTPDGIAYSVRVPSNYDPTVAHPLLMFYAPAGGTAAASERMAGLTRPGTRAGFIVAYADSRRLSIPVIRQLGRIPRLIARTWCIDERRIFLTGHSDGGTAALALAILDDTKTLPAGIAPSAAGFSGEDLARYTCPAPLPVLVLHSARDRHFPGYGGQSARWWAACNRCDAEKVRPVGDGCVAYEGCARGGPIWYCEGANGHAKWPGLNETLLRFFLSAAR